MASETTRAARALVANRVERFESRHGLELSRARLEAALAKARMEGRVDFTPTFRTEDARVILEAGFATPPRTQRFLRIMSLVLTTLLVLALWAAVASTNAAIAWLVPLFVVLVVLGFPYIFVAMGSSREAEEVRIRKAIRAALVEED